MEDRLWLSNGMCVLEKGLATVDEGRAFSRVDTIRPKPEARILVCGDTNEFFSIGGRARTDIYEKWCPGRHFRVCVGSLSHSSALLRTAQYGAMHNLGVILGMIHS